MKRSSQGRKKTTKSKTSQNKIFIVIAILTFILIIGYLQKPTQEPRAEEPTTIEEPTTEEQICTEMWLCKNANTKAYRKSDCAFEQIMDCPSGCENAECNEVIEEPKLVEPQEKVQSGSEIKTLQECTIGFKCLDENRRGYQTSNCAFSQVIECKYGCKDRECQPSLPLKEQEQEFSLTQGKLILNKTGWKYSDFSKDDIFQENINDYDFKIKLYSTASLNNYYRVESYRSDLWIIEIGIEQATRKDCIEDTSTGNSYNNLKSGETLCVRTREEDIALVGANWEGSPKEDTELTWKYYVPK